MTKKSKGYGQSGSKSGAVTGYVPVKSTVSFKGERSYETKSRVSYGDKQSGGYGRATTKEKASAGEFQWKNGTTGTRNEYKQSSTVRVGDKRGYTEVYKEQRVRNVSYDKRSSGSSYITYKDEDDNDGSYGGYDDDDDEDGGGPYGGYDDEDGGPYGSDSYDSDGGGGSYGGYDSDSGGGSYGGCDSDSDGGGSYGGGSGYDSDY